MSSKGRRIRSKGKRVAKEGTPAERRAPANRALWKVGHELAAGEIEAGNGWDNRDQKLWVSKPLTGSW
jgi:hypothetical protein